ncbi:MAG TPA: hypothetical protein RMH99_07880 [Sandaracinaceae bacterium LLY-WYZ-13_1]|nr:hypothetical protein [Sandaracinaceae bacterium LLY-WYZ-13_1]
MNLRFEARAFPVEAGPRLVREAHRLLVDEQGLDDGLEIGLDPSGSVLVAETRWPVAIAGLSSWQPEVEAAWGALCRRVGGPSCRGTLSVREADDVEAPSVRDDAPGAALEPAAPPPTAPVTRSSAALAGGLVLPLLSLGAAAALGWWAWNGGGILGCGAWLLAGAAVAFAGLAAFGAVALSGAASCAACGHRLDGLSTLEGSQLVCCEGCGAFARARRTGVELVAPDAVDPHHVFGARVSGAVRFEGCAACGAPPTRTEELTVRASEAVANLAASTAGAALAAASGAGFVRAERGACHEVSVPYCDAHEDAVRARVRGGALHLCFRSHERLRAFCARSPAVPCVAPPPSGAVDDPS